MADLEHEACSRARSWISLRLDTELSELESRAVRAHLVRCGRCREFERRVRSLTTMLREQPLVPLERPVTVLPRRGRVVRLAGFASAAAATIAVAVGVFLGASGSNHALRTEFARTPGGSPSADVNDVHALRRQVVLGSVAPRLRPAYVQRSWVDDA